MPASMVSARVVSVEISSLQKFAPVVDELPISSSTVWDAGGGCTVIALYDEAAKRPAMFSASV